MATRSPHKTKSAARQALKHSGPVGGSLISSRLKALEAALDKNIARVKALGSKPIKNVVSDKKKK